MTEQEITIIRRDLLKMLETAAPLGLKEKRLVDGLHYSGFMVTSAEFAMNKNALVEAGLIRVEEDLINKADSLHFFTESARVYLRKSGF